MLIDDHALDVMARTVYGEAGDEPFKGQLAVAYVILNRAASATVYWGHDPISVCLASNHFSCWNSGQAFDKNRTDMMSVRADEHLYRQCLAAVLSAVEHLEPDPTEGATHYYNWQAVETPPDWTEGMDNAGRIGNHQFWRDAPRMV